MTALAVVAAPVDGSGISADYASFVAGLDLGASAHELRNRCSRKFLAAYPNLDEWMARPIAARLTDLSRTNAWPFVCWAALTGRVAPDLDLLVARRQGGMHVLCESLHADGFAVVRRAAERLDWGPRWTDHVLVVSLPRRVPSWAVGVPPINRTRGYAAAC